MEQKEMRADIALCAQGLATSREKARKLIEAGLANVNGTAILKPSQKVRPSDALSIVGQVYPYVSRGGLKLEKALRAFEVPVFDLTCMDIGASTGGFTDVLLRNGARRVYAIDVGTGQLDQRLLCDPRVISMEHVNARSLDIAMFEIPPTLGVMDVSFISIRLILPAAFTVLGPAGHMIALIKPQFEAGKALVGKRGIVSKPEVHRMVLEQLASFVLTQGWSLRQLDYSPIAGGDGNLEFLADMLPQAQCNHQIDSREIDAVVKQAHSIRL